MIFIVCLPSATGRGVGQQRQLTRVLHRDRHVTLVLYAVAGHPTRPDLAAVGDELAEQRGVLVVDAGRLLLAELANLLLRLAHHCLGHCGAPFARNSVSPSLSDGRVGMEWWDLFSWSSRLDARPPVDSCPAGSRRRSERRLVGADTRGGPGVVRRGAARSPGRSPLRRRSGRGPRVVVGGRGLAAALLPA